MGMCPTRMTSGGESDTIDKAKKTIIAAIIGLAIVLMAYAITTFVVNTLLNSSGGGGQGNTPSAGNSL